MECPFVVGQKVVCINDEGWFNVLGEPIEGSGPKIGDICQIIELCAQPDDIYLRFKEYNSDPYTRFNHQSFRPLEERKTDISVFRKMLNPVREDVEAMTRRDLRNLQPCND